MVLAEKNNENPRNGRRSMGPSPNGHVHADSTSEDEVPIDKIRVGRDYQAVCPELQPENERKPELLADRALLVWSPTETIAETKLEDYIVLAKDKYGYNGEQALGMLFWHKHDLERAMLDLANFTPFPDEWSVEDKVLFEQAFQFHGKSFHRIRQMLPDKSIASLVKYYYGWKKTRSRSSLMDKQAKKLNASKEDGVPSEGGSDNGSIEESDHEDKRTRKGKSPSHPRRPSILEKKPAPVGASAAACAGRSDGTASLLQIQQNKQGISSLKRKHAESVEDLRPTGDAHPGRFNSRWSHDELLIAVQGVKKYGKDFKSIADTIGNKSEHHVRAFFVNYRKRYNLDTVLKEWETDNGRLPSEESSADLRSTDADSQDNDVICISPPPVQQQEKKKETKNGKVNQTAK